MRGPSFLAVLADGGIVSLTYRKSHVLAVQVFPSASRPHHLTSSGPVAGTYVRVGSTNRRADEALVAEVRERIERLVRKTG